MTDEDEDHWICGRLAGELECHELIRNQTRILNVEEDPLAQRRCARAIADNTKVPDAPSRDLIECRGWAGIERMAGIGLAEDLDRWLRDYDAGWWSACVELAGYSGQ